MKQKIVSCDICGKERGKLSERWFKVWLEQDAGYGFAVRAICEPYSHSREGKDACGDICTLRLLGRWLEHGNLEEGEPRPVKARSA